MGFARHILLIIMITLPAMPAVHAGSAPQPYIVGGKNVPEAEFPFMTALIDRRSPSNYDGQFCGGALIAPGWVLTAAHCVFRFRHPGELAVQIGVTRLTDDAADRLAVTGFVSHPDYDDKTLVNDVALLALATPSLSTPVALASRQDVAALPMGADVLAIGWGRTNADGADAQFPTILQQITLDFIPRDVCDAAGYYPFPVTPDQFCAGNFVSEPAAGGFPEILGGGICNGDSGGPLLHDGKQIGIASFGPDVDVCAVAGVPDGYINISLFADWIRRVQDGADIAVDITRQEVSETISEATITVSNRSPVNAAKDVVLTLEIPIGTVGLPNLDTVADCGGTPITCHLGDIAAGDHISLVFQLDTAPDAGWRLVASTDNPGDYDHGNDQVTIEANLPPAGRGHHGGSIPALVLLLLTILVARRG